MLSEEFQIRSPQNERKLQETVSDSEKSKHQWKSELLKETIEVSFEQGLCEITKIF